MLAPYQDGIPVVADANDRTQKFAVPATDQRVYNKTSGAIERWDGAQWVTDIALSQVSGILLIGPDCSIYRLAANVLRTDDSLQVGGDVAMGGDLVASGGFRQTIDGWYQDNVVANQADVELSRATGRFRAARAGSVTAIVVTATEARTGGTLTVKVFKNVGLAGAAGAQLGAMSAVLDGVNTSRKASVQAKDTDAFAAGDELYCTVATDAGWLPVTSDVRVALEIED